MAEIAYYHLLNLPLEKVLPVLLKKTLGAGKRAVVITGTTERLEGLSSLLWTAEPDSWIPHGSEKDGCPEYQPIWLTVHMENLNDATFLFLTDGAVVESLEGFERCFDLFDGSNTGSTQGARERWEIQKKAGHRQTYWQQNKQGIWEEKAMA